jgi:MoxR-like ATPase
MTVTDIKMPKCWLDVQDAMDGGARVILLHGGPGTGKSFGGMKQGLRDGQEVFRLPCHADLHEGHLTGQDKPKAGDWQWRKGLAIHAWEAGARLVIDECDLAPQEVRGLLQLVLDSPNSARWTHPDTGDVVVPKDGFSCVLTMNGEPSHLPPPIVDRVDVSVLVDAPHPDALLRYPAPARVTIMDLASRGTVTLRKIDAFYRMAERITPKRAATLVFPDNPSIGDLLTLAEVD